MTVPAAVGYDGKTGSAERLITIFKYFRRLDNGIIFVFNASGPIARYFQKNGVVAQYNILPTKLKFSSYIGLCLKTIFLMAKAFFVFTVPRARTGNEKVVVYASSDLFWEVIPAFISKTRNKEIEWVQIIHHIYPDWKKRPGNKIIGFLGYYLQRLSFWLIRKKADKIILMNNLIRNELLSKGFLGQKMRVSSNGLNLDYLNSLQPSNLAYDGVFLGRMNASKGVEDLLPIWKKVCEKIPGAKLALIGGAEKKTKTNFIQKIKAAGMEKNIEVLGFLEDDKTFSILKASKIFLFPSHEEGWGIAIAEACGCGLPVVSWDLPVYQEIFADYTFQIKENNTDAFAEQIIKLLFDDSYQREVGSKGREFIKKCSWAEVARRELEIIKA